MTHLFHGTESDNFDRFVQTDRYQQPHTSVNLQPRQLSLNETFMLMIFQSLTCSVMGLTLSRLLDGRHPGIRLRGVVF